MKKLLIMLFVLSTQLVFSQSLPPESIPDYELKGSEAELRIADWQARVDELKAKYEKATTDRDALKKELEDAIQNLKDCQKALNSFLGATDADYENFRQRLGVIKGKVRAMQRLSNDELADRRDDVVALEASLNELRKEKLSLLPEFYNDIISLAKDIKGLYREKKITTYTVGTWAENRDCLWNIAGRTEIYNDAFLWPKIWQENTDVIRNPDIIQPGWVLKLPKKGPKNASELKAERKYWRAKREAEQATTGSNEVE